MIYYAVRNRNLVPFFVIKIGELMHTYTFENTENGERFDRILSMAERQEYLDQNPNIKQLIVNAPALGDSVRLGLRKPDDAFRDVLKNVKKHHPGSIKKDGVANKINTW